MIYYKLKASRFFNEHLKRGYFPKGDSFREMEEQQIEIMTTVFKIACCLIQLA